MDAIVQFYRNALCCIKDLGLLQDSLPFLWDASVTMRYYDLPAPLNQTTPLEVLISLGQLYAVVSLVKAGWTLFATSIGKMMRIQRFMETRREQKAQTTDADRFMNESLVKEGMLAIRSMFVGFILFFLGLSFIWLFANSWHITETDWIGGLQGLIHALTVMEIGLFPLLHYMVKDGKAQLAKARRMKNMAEQLRAGTLTRHDLDLSSLEELTGWEPFWDAGISPIATWTRAHADESQEKSMALEKSTVANSLDALFGKEGEKTRDGGDGEKEDKIRKELWQAKADDVSSAASVARMEGYREFLYFVLNFIAFYGYLLSVICFYYPHPFNRKGEHQDEQFNNTTTTPLVVRRLMFHLDPDLADWRGNFAGDLMWTVEPIIILTSPFLISWVKPKTKKATAAIKTKAD